MTVKEAMIAAEESRGTFKAYPVAYLKEVFDEMTAGMPNWKEPIKATLPVAKLGAAIHAVEFYAGSPLKALSGIYTNASGQEVIDVYAPGYYASVGA